MIGCISTIFGIAFLAIFILLIIGLIGAIQGVRKEIPLIEKKVQDQFPNI